MHGKEMENKNSKLPDIYLYLYRFLHCVWFLKVYQKFRNLFWDLFESSRVGNSRFFEYIFTT